MGTNIRVGMVGLLLAGGCTAPDHGDDEGLGAAADSGATADAADAADAAEPPESERKRVFFHLSGTLGKIRNSGDPRPALAVADESCTLAASDRGIEGTWRAWLSSSEENAIDRIEGVGPWYRVDRATILFRGKDDLHDGPIAVIDPDAHPERNKFWTGTLPDGTRSSDLCNDWTVYQGLYGTVGRVDVTGAAWAATDRLHCGEYLALLCIEQQ
jgi:hypothetical protein